MAQEQVDIIRLKEDGKVKGYVRIDNKVFNQKTGERGNVEFSSDMKNWVATNFMSWDSFDHSLKQGDEWFFEGDGVEATMIDGQVFRGVLIYDGLTGWVIDTGKVRFQTRWIDEHYTLKLIKRAV